MPKYHGGYKRGQNSPMNASAKNTTEENVTRHCHDCNRTGTPQWREGPDGPKTLCNACGVKRQRLRRGPRPAAAAAVLDAPRLPSQRLARSSKRTRLSESSEEEQERVSVHDDTGNEDEGEESDQDMAVLNLLCFASSSDVPLKRRRGAGLRSEPLSEAQPQEDDAAIVYVLPNINPLQAALIQCTSLPQGAVSDPELGVLHKMHMTFQTAWVTLSLANTAQAAAEETLRGAELGADQAREAVQRISLELSHRLSSLAQQANNGMAQPPFPPPAAPPPVTTLNLAPPPQAAASHFATTLQAVPSHFTANTQPPPSHFAFPQQLPPSPFAPPQQLPLSSFGPALHMAVSFVAPTLQLALQKVEANTNSGNAHHHAHTNTGDDDANNHASDNENKYTPYHRALNGNPYNGSNLGNNNSLNLNSHNSNNVNNNIVLQGVPELTAPAHHQHHHHTTINTTGLHLGNGTVRMATAGHSHDHAAAMNAIAMGVIV